MGEKQIVQNRSARRDYHVLETYEAGIELRGTEVKSLRDGRINLKDSYADVANGELLLIGAHISPYDKGNVWNHDPERTRKLLMHKRQIVKLGQQTAEKGLTLVPLRLYFSKGIVKVEIALCKGKQTHDKRDTIREREVKREIERYTKRPKT
ncbi:MAG TPA: SsrA-binding protein SmpB [Candidatus Hydrogenedentes bacterium]|nr:SsrA-binding protein SmpB [Candidatus Hydrogenedentota bacterium]HOS01839.1 SsrA-binding protein SmpB [Candidatus Hydrogenedentota bacterium]